MMQPDSATFEQAAAWYLDLRGAAPDAPVHQAHAHWLTQDPAHRVAWERVQRLQQTFGQLPVQFGSNTLHVARASRRQTIKKLTVLLMLGSTASLAWQNKTTLHAYAANHRTGTGERRQIALEDGGQLNLNTATAVDIQYDQAQRRIRLYGGEILVTTAPDLKGRPFLVDTRHGRIRALGTRFLVRDEGESSLVQVLEHAVAIQPANGSEAVVLGAGQQIRFTSTDMQSASLVERNAGSWRDGLLVVDNWPLERVTHELSRYYTGLMACDAQVAQLAVSGMFHLSDIPDVLHNLSATLPIRVEYRTRFWVRIVAA
jgi:transmembrane sensor